MRSLLKWLAIILVVGTGLRMILVSSRMSNPSQPNYYPKAPSLRSYPQELVSSAPESTRDMVLANVPLIGVKGTIICQNYNTVSMLIQLYQDAWRSALEDHATGGQTRLLHGEPARSPDPEMYGCIVVAPGTSMSREPGTIVPVVRVKMADGTWIKGVTNPNMIVRDADYDPTGAPVSSTETRLQSPEPVVGSGTSVANDSDNVPVKVLKTEEEASWATKINGDKVLDGPSGPCATLIVYSPDDPNELVLRLDDASVQSFKREDIQRAMAAGRSYCQSEFSDPERPGRSN